MESEPRRINDPLLWILLLGLALRLGSLGADAPVQWLRRLPGEQITGAFFSDEGWYNRNALREVLASGSAFPADQINPARLTPLYYLIQRQVLGLGTLSLSLARLTSVLAGTLLLTLCLLLLPEKETQRWGLALLAADFVLLSFSRLALPETTGLLFLLTSGVAACKGFPLVTGGLVLGALTVKPTFLLPALLGAAAATERKHLPRLALGLTLTGVLVFLWVYLPHLEELRALTQRLSSKRTFHPANLWHFLRDGVWWLHWGPALPCALYVATRPGRDQETRWALGALIGGLLVVAPSGYQPLRYHLAWALPALLLLARGSARNHSGSRWVRLGAVGLLCFDLLRMGTSPTRFTLRDAAREAGHLTQGRSTRVLGHVADSFALEAHWSTVNPPVERASPAAAQRIQAAHPTHILTLRAGEAERWRARFLPACTLEAPVGTWPVMGNYYTGDPVRLYPLRCW
jgi:hypothetical protein